MALRVVAAPTQGKLVPCTECGRCCTYVAVGINAPRTPRYATDVLWYLYHERVSVHRDVDGDWSVVFETRCRNLGPDLLCGVYEQRPHICRAFDNTGCEVNSPDTRDRVFVEPSEFLDYLRSWRPRVYARLRARFVPDAHRLSDDPQPPTGRRAQRAVPGDIATRRRRRAAPG